MGMREVHIKPVSNGFIVTVGCQTLVYLSIEALAEDLVRYQKDPQGREKYHYDHLVNKDDAPQTTAPAIRPATYTEVNCTQESCAAGSPL